MLSFQGHTQLYEDQNAVLQRPMIPLHGSYTQTAHQKALIAGSLRTGLAQLGWSFPELLTSFLHSFLQLFCLRPRQRPHPYSQYMIWFTALAGDVGQ